MKIFPKFTLEQIKKYIQDLDIKRKIREFHLHHTFKPDINDWQRNPDGNYWQNVIYRYHTGTNGWSDIGQHLTYTPDHYFYLGRDLEKDPASIKGRNEGALALEILGNFDVEHLDGQSKYDIVEFTRFVMDYFNVDVVFHNEYSSKTCPGKNIYKPYFMEWLEMAELEGKFYQIKKIVEG